MGGACRLAPPSLGTAEDDQTRETTGEKPGVSIAVAIILEVISNLDIMTICFNSIARCYMRVRACACVACD